MKLTYGYTLANYFLFVHKAESPMFHLKNYYFFTMDKVQNFDLQ